MEDHKNIRSPEMLSKKNQPLELKVVKPEEIIQEVYWAYIAEYIKQIAKEISNAVIGFQDKKSQNDKLPGILRQKRKRLQNGDLVKEPNADRFKEFIEEFCDIRMTSCQETILDKMYKIYMEESAMGWNEIFNRNKYAERIPVRLG